MRGIWAITRHTFAQCLRMKVAVVFIVLLAVVLGTLPFTIESGDGTLGGRIRTFLYYSSSVTSLLLSLVAVLLTTQLVDSDVRDKQIFTIVTKPISRWQYILGRWLGVVLLCGMLLVVAAGVTYGVAGYLRRRPALNAGDRRAIETEIFTARRRVWPEPIDVEPAVARRIEELKKTGGYEKAIEGFLLKAGGDTQRALKNLEQEIRKQILQARQSCAFGRSLSWRFKGIKSTGQQRRGTGRVLAIDRENRLMRIEADPLIIGQLLYEAPVRIEGVDAQVVNITEKYLDVRFFGLDDMKKYEIARLSKGSEVGIVVDPSFQLRFKLDPAGSVADSTLYSSWIVENLKSGYRRLYSRYKGDPVNIPVTLTIPARAAEPDGSLRVTFVNLGNTKVNFRGSVAIPPDAVVILYRAGGFEMNFVRGWLLIMLQVALLSAVGIFAGSFLSSPVARLVCLVLMVFGLARGFLSESLRIVDIPGIESGPTVIVGHYMQKVMNVVVPDFQDTSPADSLVDGLLISWRYVAARVTPLLVVRIGLFLAAACLIFRRRELARVQV